MSDAPTAPSATPWRIPLAWQLAAIIVVVAILWGALTRPMVQRDADRREELADRVSALEEARALGERLGTALARLELARATEGPLGATAPEVGAALALLTVTSDSIRVAIPSARVLEELRHLQGLAARRAAAAPADRALADSAMRAARALLAAIHADADAARELQRDVEADARRSAVITRIGVIATVLLIIVLVSVRVQRVLATLVGGARALAEGRFAEARLDPAAVGASREMTELSVTFDALATAIEARQRQLEDDLVKLRDLERMKTDFVSTVSHELRTPLTSMRGALGLVLGGATGGVAGKTRDLLGIALQNTERLIRLINDILDIEKIESGRLALRQSPCDLTAVVELAVAGVQGMAQDQQVTLEVEAPAGIMVTGDEDRLVQVLTNFLSNAIKFSPADGTVHVTLVAAGEWATVSVRDEGSGIPEAFRDRIFGRFQQADASVARKHPGTGLGLAISKALVEQHGGEVGFTTEAGVGTTFFARLPWAPQGTPVAPGSGPRILIVEDTPDLLQVLLQLAAPYGTAVGARDAEEALRMAAEGPLGCVIVDPGLPGMDGYGLVRRLRDDPQHSTVPVILFTAADPGDEQLRAAGIRRSYTFVKSRDSETAVISALQRALAAAR